MKASLRWLRTLVPGLDVPASEVARRLTGAGLEVEGTAEFGSGTEQLRVARVKAIEPHPTKSGLRLVTVDRGDATQQVVCGAPNVPAPGGLVVLAPLGAHLPAIDMTITPRAIAGVTSEGMLCSEREMGIGEGSDGILILHEGTPGQPLTDAVPGVRDTILEINVTPNRPDALGHLGLARDLGVLGDLPLAMPLADEHALATRIVADAVPVGEGPAGLGVAIESDERCPEYGAAILENIVVGPSPSWVRYRLQSLGVRSINNVVDATNLLLLEFGQPTHAFDLDRVAGHALTVRTARPGERLTTLDGKDRPLDPDDLVIADATGPTALAGVMGGAASEVSATTTRVVLECAFFEPRGVRRTARRHGLHSEASHRFERGVDRAGIVVALGRLLRLFAELCPGCRVVGEPVVVRRRSFEPAPIRIRSERLDALLGDTVPFDEARSILTRLGCTEVPYGTAAGAETANEAANGAGAAGEDGRRSGQTSEAGVQESRAAAAFTPPGWRPDLLREADLIEEVGRIRGYDRIAPSLPALVAPPPVASRLDEKLRQAAVELGLSEAVTYTFVAPSQLEALGAQAPAVKLLNPLSEERSVLRTSMLPGLLEALGRARRRGERGARLFSVGRTFHRTKLAAAAALANVESIHTAGVMPSGEGTQTATVYDHILVAADGEGVSQPSEATRVGVDLVSRRGVSDDGLPHERRWLAVVLAGPRPGYLTKPEEHDLLDAKAVAHELVGRALGREPTSEPWGAGRPAHLHPRGAARLLLGHHEVGQFGLLHPDVIDRLDLGGPAVVVELDLDALGREGERTAQAVAIPRLPSVWRDLSVEVSDPPRSDFERSGVIEETIRQAAGDLCERVELVATFGLPEQKVSLTYRVTYRDPLDRQGSEGARTLTDAEVDRQHEQARKALQSNIILR